MKRLSNYLDQALEEGGLIRPSKRSDRLFKRLAKALTRPPDPKACLNCRPALKNGSITDNIFANDSLDSFQAPQMEFLRGFPGMPKREQ